MSLWEDVKKNVVDIYSVTSDKTTEMAKVGSRKWDKFGISRDIERQFSELGNLVYTGLTEGKDNLLEDPAISVLMTRIQALEGELKQKEAEIDNIHQAQKTKKAAEAAAAGGAAGAGFSDPSADDSEYGAETVEAEVLIKDPVLEPGNDESAILVEPGTEGPGEGPEDIEPEKE